MVELKSERLLLRPWKESDAEELSRIANNKNIAQNMNGHFPFPYTLECAKDWISKAKEKPVQTNFAIEYEGKLAGGVGFDLRDNEREGVASGGYWLGEEFWGKGIATEAWKMVIDYGFENFPIRKVEASAYSWNSASIKVQEKCGFRHEGCLRQGIIRFGKVGDEHKLAILREEWESK
jgi:[ribosomal protein S5]-alanine N-acetyltransferase